MMKNDVELGVEPYSAKFDPDDERWLRQVSELTRELGESGAVRIASPPIPGAKGTIESVLMALGSAGALTATVEVFKAWLGRDQTRSIKVTFRADGGVQSLELNGKDANDEVAASLTRKVLEQLDDP